jgi:hypothetical protein
MLLLLRISLTLVNLARKKVEWYKITNTLQESQHIDKLYKKIENVGFQNKYVQ